MTATLTRADYSAPDATLLLRADASRDEWLAARRTGIGGSDAAAVLGENPYRSPYHVWLDKTGRAAETEQTDAMRFGRWLEDHLAGWFTEQTGIATRRAGLRQSKARPWQLASVDRDGADGGVWEAKTTGGHTANADVWRGGGVPRDAWLQGQHYLAVTGRSHLWFTALVDRTPIIAGPYPRDEELLPFMQHEEEEFWWYVAVDQPPPVDPDRITAEEIALRWPTEVTGSTTEAPWPEQVAAMLAERADVKATAKAASDRAAEIDQALKVMCGEAETLLCHGRPVATYRSRAGAPHVDKALATDMPQVWNDYVSTPSHRALNVIKEKP